MDRGSADFTPAKRCAKCMSPIAEPDWVVNKVMAYCAECASLLHLGESKESRMFNDPKGALAVSETSPQRPGEPPEDLPVLLEEDIPELEP